VSLDFRVKKVEGHWWEEKWDVWLHVHSAHSGRVVRSYGMRIDRVPRSEGLRFRLKDRGGGQKVWEEYSILELAIVGAKEMLLARETQFLLVGGRGDEVL